MNDIFRNADYHPRAREHGGKTKMEMSVVYSSAEAHDGALKNPMADGMEAGCARRQDFRTGLMRVGGRFAPAFRLGKFSS